MKVGRHVITKDRDGKLKFQIERTDHETGEKSLHDMPWTPKGSIEVIGEHETHNIRWEGNRVFKQAKPAGSGKLEDVEEYDFTRNQWVQIAAKQNAAAARPVANRFKSQPIVQPTAQQMKAFSALNPQQAANVLAAIEMALDALRDECSSEEEYEAKLNDILANGDQAKNDFAAYLNPENMKKYGTNNVSQRGKDGAPVSYADVQHFVKQRIAFEKAQVQGKAASFAPNQPKPTHDPRANLLVGMDVRNGESAAQIDTRVESTRRSIDAFSLVKTEKEMAEAARTGRHINQGQYDNATAHLDELQRAQTSHTRAGRGVTQEFAAQAADTHFARQAADCFNSAATVKENLTTQARTAGLAIPVPAQPAPAAGARRGRHVQWAAEPVYVAPEPTLVPDHVDDVVATLVATRNSLHDFFAACIRYHMQPAPSVCVVYVQVTVVVTPMVEARATQVQQAFEQSLALAFEAFHRVPTLFNAQPNDRRQNAELDLAEEFAKARSLPNNPAELDEKASEMGMDSQSLADMLKNVLRPR